MTIQSQLSPKVRKNLPKHLSVLSAYTDKKTRRGERKLLCRCVCLNMFFPDPQKIREGKSATCGCRYIGTPTLDERDEFTRRLHYNIFMRCYNKAHQGYSNYGGRGIYVDESRNDYRVFRKDILSMEREEGHSLDRIDNDGPYSKDNCRFTDRETQANNKRKNRGGKRMYLIGSKRKHMCKGTKELKEHLIKDISKGVSGSNIIHQLKKIGYIRYGD